MWNLLLLLLLPALAFAEYCEQKSPCECQFSDGTSINLSHLLKNDPNDGTLYLYDTKDNITIYYHGCFDVPFKVDIQDVTQEHCRSPATICVFHSDSREVLTLGNTKSGRYQVDEHGIHTLQYVISSVTTIVQLICTPEYDDNNIDFHNISSDGRTYHLQLFSARACRSTLPQALSTGTKLLIMFFTFLLVYFIGGALLAFFVRGARGRELIPNVDFWTGLPGLVKDGVVFLLSGCSTRLVTTAETYDQI